MILTLTNIGTIEVSCVFKINDAKYLVLPNGDTYDIPTSPYWNITNTEIDTYIANGLPLATSPLPSKDHYWDVPSQEWKLSPETISRLIEEALATSRDSYLEQSIEFSKDTNTFYVKNDQRTQNAIASYDRAVAKENDEAYTVNFYAYDNLDNHIWVVLNGADIQELDSTLTANMKKAFDSMKTVLDTHLSTPYATVEDAVNAYTTLLGE